MESHYFEQFVAERNLSKATVKQYRATLKQYCEFQGLSLDELMTYIEKDCVQYEKTHEIHVLIPTKEALIKPYQNLFKDKKIIWHEYDTNKPLKKVTRNTVVKNNNNAVVYFSSIGVDYGSITTHGLNPNFKINYSNYSDSTKIIYNKE